MTNMVEKGARILIFNDKQVCLLTNVLVNSKIPMDARNERGSSEGYIHHNLAANNLEL